MRVSSSMHDDNWHSENPQPYLVEKESNFTLTCTAKRPSGSSLQLKQIIWFVNSTVLVEADCKNGKQSPDETCSLTLRWPDVGGNYTCQAVNIKNVCTFQVLELKVAGESRLIQVSNYYYYYYHHHHFYYYYYYYYYYYIIIIKGPMLGNFACNALRRWPGNIMKKHAKDLS